MIRLVFKDSLIVGCLLCLKSCFVLLMRYFIWLKQDKSIIINRLSRNYYVMVYRYI